MNYTVNQLTILKNLIRTNAEVYTKMIDRAIEEHTERSGEPEVPASGLSEEEAIAEAHRRNLEPLPDLDAAWAMQVHQESFDDIVEDGELVMDKVVEYSKSIQFNIFDVSTGNYRVGEIIKYPGFIKLFGVDTATDIKLSDIVKKFIPGKWEADMARESERDALSQAYAHLIGDNGDFSHEITDEDRAKCKELYNADLSNYATAADIAKVLDLEVPSEDDLDSYVPEDTPVELQGLLDGIPDSLKKLVGI